MNNNKYKIKSSEFSHNRETVLNNLNTNPEWSIQLKYNPIKYIIKNGTPGEVFLLLKHVYKLDYKHALYRLIESAVFKQKAIHKIASKKYIQQNNKSIDRDLSFYFQLQKIHQLVDLGSTDYLDVIKAEIVKLMNFQDNNGRFPMNYHHHAHACSLLFDLGMEGNKLLDKSILWVVSRQRDDGGWIHINNLPKGVKHSEAKSCIWTTAEVALLLSKRKIFRNSDYFFRANEFLANNYLNKNRSTLLSKADSWDCLTVNHTSEHMFAGGTLKILEILLCNKNIDSKIIKKMFKWLLEQQLESGLFPKIANKHPIPDVLVTIRVLRILKKHFEYI